MGSLSRPATRPTSASSEHPVHKAADSEPWKSGTTGKYQYHPGGDTSAPKKDAPSALNEVIVPNVTLPKVSAAAACYRLLAAGCLLPCSDHRCSRCTIGTTSTARRTTDRARCLFLYFVGCVRVLVVADCISGVYIDRYVYRYIRQYIIGT